MNELLQHIILVGIAVLIMGGTFWGIKKEAEYTKNNCIEQCDKFDYEYWKASRGKLSNDECWCIKPNGEPVNIGD